MRQHRFTVLGGLILGFLALPAAGQGAGARWTHASGNLNWIGERVSLGNQGTQAFTELGPVYPGMLFSAFDQGTPIPVWETPAALYYNHSIDSAEEGDLHVSLVQVDTSQGRRQAILRVYRSTSPAPVWTATLPTSINNHQYSKVFVSDDGETIVACVFNTSTYRLETFVFDDDSSTPRAAFVLDTFGLYRALEVTADGRTLYVASDVAVRVFDLGSGAMLVADYPPGGTVPGHAIAGDGSAFAYGGFGLVRVFRRVGQTYVLDFVHQNPGSNRCTRIAISRDGSTMACGFDFYDGYHRVDVQAVDLDTQALLMNESVWGSGSLQNLARDIDISDTGDRFAVGLSGDGGSVRQIRVYDSGRNVPIQTYLVEGSVNDVDLSADGKRLAVANKAVHTNIFGTGGRIDLFDLEAFDLDVREVPHAGSSVDLVMKAAPGSQGILFVAPTAAQDPVLLPGVGTFYLRRDRAVPRSIGTADSTGTIRTTFSLAGQPLGASLFLQGFTPGQQPRVTDDWVKITVVP